MVQELKTNPTKFWQEVPAFYTWALRKCQQHGIFQEADWAYFFHGFACDLKNITEGRGGEFSASGTRFIGREG